MTSHYPAFGVLIVGDEILSGKRADKHLTRAIELLGERGLSLSWAEYVGDSRAGITQRLRRILDSSDVVFSFGGIGATPDDHTRQCAAEALGQPLALHPRAAELIRARMREVAAEQGVAYDPQRADNVHRLNMGVFPVGSEIIPNPYNRIPGFSCRGRGGAVLHFLPGFPVMAWPMMAWTLDTHYRHCFGSGAQQERSLIIPGAMEATLTPLMEAVERDHPEVKVFSLPSVDHAEYGRHVELGVKGAATGVPAAFDALKQGVLALGQTVRAELVRGS